MLAQPDGVALGVADGVPLGVGSLLAGLADGELLVDADGTELLDWVWVIVTVAVGLDEDVAALAGFDVAGAVVLGAVVLVLL